MFNTKTVLDLHSRVLEKYGGALGVRDNNLLDSAINCPFQTFGGEDLYSTWYEKAAAVMQSLIINHPFVDGNKRTGFLLGETLLLNGNLEISAPENDCYDFVIKIFTGELGFDDIALWLLQNTKPILR